MPEIPFRQMTEKFLLETDAGEATSRAYRNALKQFGAFVMKKKISRPMPEHVIQFREWLKDEGRSASTRQLYLVALRRFYSWGAKQGMANIAEGIKGAKPGSKLARGWLSAEKARELLDAARRDRSLKGKRDYALIALMLTTGMRCVEIRRANRTDIRRLENGPALFIQGKGRDAKDDYVKLTDEVMAALEGYFKARNEADARGSLFASLSPRGRGRMTTRSISRIVKERLRSIGLDDPSLCAHSLRHTTATLNILNGATLEETKQLLRHKSMDTTLRYSHALERAKNQSEARIGGVLFA